MDVELTSADAPTEADLQWNCSSHN